MKKMTQIMLQRNLQKIFTIISILSSVYTYMLISPSETRNLSLATDILGWIVILFINCFIFKSLALSLIIANLIIISIYQISLIKFSMLKSQLSFIDINWIDRGTLQFGLSLLNNISIYKNLKNILSINTDYILLGLGCIIILTIIITVKLFAQLDPLKIDRKISLAVITISFPIMIFVTNSLANSQPPLWDSEGKNHLSGFASSLLMYVKASSKGILEQEPVYNELIQKDNPICNNNDLPNIILILEESDFDITLASGIKVPENYQNQFKSYDNKLRYLLVEGSGGPTAYAEFNVLSGLSARSFGLMSTFASRIAADKIHRGLAFSLNNCGYETISLYNSNPFFLNSAAFYKSMGINRFIEPSHYDPKISAWSRNRLFYENVLRLVREKKSHKPIFIFVLTLFNHFPYDEVKDPDSTPDYVPLGNTPQVEEYLRRQSLNLIDRKYLLESLARDFPSEKFLIIRFGDHQPFFASKIIEPMVNDEEKIKQISNEDPRFFSTYYQIDNINFHPKSIQYSYENLASPYLPLIILMNAGIPLDSSFEKQKDILIKCNGLFFTCLDKSEVPKFNYLLRKAGYIDDISISSISMTSCYTIEGEPPKLIETIKNYNIVKFKDLCYAIPHGIMVDWSDKSKLDSHKFPHSPSYQNLKSKL